jgi:hypothetical protein
MNADHHLEERQLEMIRSWPDTDHPGLMEYVESLWRMGDWGWKQQRNPFTRQVASRTYQVSTGGWPGNEVIITALEANRSFWEQCWLSYRVGGHYEFQVRMATTSLQGGAGSALTGENQENPT